jgi:hypothetical protein
MTSELSPTLRRRRKSAVPQSAEPTSELREAVEMLRLLMRRAAELADQCQTLNDLLKLLDVYGKTGTRLGQLLRAERQLDQSADTGALLSQALSEALEELRCTERE